MAESEGIEPDYQLPDIDDAVFFTSTLSEVGEAKQADGGLVSIGWSDLLAWSEMTGSHITPGEATALRYLSSVYVSQYYESLDPATQSPNIERLKDREVVANKMKSLFAMLRGGNG